MRLHSLVAERLVGVEGFETLLHTALLRGSCPVSLRPFGQPLFFRIRLFACPSHLSIRSALAPPSFTPSWNFKAAARPFVTEEDVGMRTVQCNLCKLLQILKAAATLRFIRFFCVSYCSMMFQSPLFLSYLGTMSNSLLPARVFFYDGLMLLSRLLKQRKVKTSVLKNIRRVGGRPPPFDFHS